MQIRRFVNVSNHPSDRWSEEQRQAALHGGLIDEIVDLPFPEINPTLCKGEVKKLAEDFLREHQNLLWDQDNIVLVQGEPIFSAHLREILLKNGILAVVATSRRIVEDLPDGRKAVKFEFVRFR